MAPNRPTMHPAVTTALPLALMMAASCSGAQTGIPECDEAIESAQRRLVDAQNARLQGYIDGRIPPKWNGAPQSREEWGKAIACLDHPDDYYGRFKHRIDAACPNDNKEARDMKSRIDATRRRVESVTGYPHKKWCKRPY